ncbi:DNA primase [Lachnospiraceae bacterium]|nr:DNA primase [Lachnospiraceae bacterium]
MSIFSEVKEYLTARQAAESYGLQVKRNGLACCPFHNDKHPSMKIDKNYHCFSCGVGGDAVDYVSRMFGLSQYDAALKLIEDFTLPRNNICRSNLIHFLLPKIRNYMGLYHVPLIPL